MATGTLQFQLPGAQEQQTQLLERTSASYRAQYARCFAVEPHLPLCYCLQVGAEEYKGLAAMVPESTEGYLGTDLASVFAVE